MTNIKFTKMQALGNDFVVIDATKQPFLLTPQQMQQMSDRRCGVGFDQLLVLELSRHQGSDFYYRIFNADGAEVGQCGNGARCVALYIKEKALSDKDAIVLQTREVKMQCRLLSDGRVSVLMGQPKFEPEEIPFDPSQPPSLDREFGVVNVGNPHAVMVVDDVDAVDLTRLGRAFEADARFPEGVNVSVMSVRQPNALALRVFERGVGETEACGSAACAAMVLGRKQGLLDARVVVSQPGGDLEIIWQDVDSSIEMIGPAAFVFYGDYPLL